MGAQNGHQAIYIIPSTYMSIKCIVNLG